MTWSLLQNSLLVGGATTLCAALLGFAAAVFLAGLERNRRHGVLALAIVALAMPPFLATNAWLDLLGANGWLRRWVPVNIYSLPGAVWILTLFTWPISLLAVLSAWRRLEPGQLESDPALRGAALIRWLLWPMARAAMGLAAALTFVLALNNFAVPALLQVKVAPAELWVSFNTNLDSWAAFRTGWPLILAPLLLVLVVGGWTEGRWPRLEGDVSARLFRRQIGRNWFLGAGIVTGGLLLVSVAAPLFELIFSARTWTELPPALAAGTAAIRNSVVNASVTATATVVIGLLWASRRSRPARSVTRVRPALLLWLPLFIPGVFLGIALIWAFNRPAFAWLYHGSGMVWLALVIRYLAPGWLGATAAMNNTDPDLADCARVDGARGWTLFRHVQWPQIAGQVAAVWYVVYLLCLWDVETLVLIQPPGGETLALRIFNLLHYGHNAQVNALCVILLLIAVLPLALWHGQRCFRRRHTACDSTSGGLVRAFIKRHRGVADRAVRGAATEHDTPSRIVCAVAITLSVFALAGCSPSPGPGARLDSRIFSHVEILGARGRGPGQFNKPRSLALDAKDNLYVADMTGRVQKFSPEGEYLLSWQMPETDLGKAKGMARDHQGNIVVIEPHYQRLNHFTPQGKLVFQWGEQGTNDGRFSLPRAVAVNSRGELAVSEYTLRERVQRFSPQGAFLGGFGEAGTAPGEFNRPEGVDVDAADRIYVADSCNHRIQVFSPEGTFLRSYGRAGTGPGEMSYPYDVRVDEAGRQYVCEFGNSRIQVFDAQDRPVEVIGKAGAAPGEFANPWSIALDSHGNLFVADSQNHRVQKLVRRTVQ